MNKRLFVGGLPYTMNNQQLADLFSSHGTVVSSDVISDRFSGRSKGFGFVEMSTEEEAQNAIKALNESTLEGRKLVVNEAKPKEERPRNDSERRFSGNQGRGQSFRHGGDRRQRTNRW